MPPTARYDRPFHWWGPGWDTPTPRTLADLLRDGALDPTTAALLWAALARRHSLVVIGGQAGLGKTTLLTALLPLLPPNTLPLYLRGCFESFAFLEDESIDPTQTALLINEISPHLPVYLWGPAVSRALHAAQRGFTLLATAHGDSLHNFVASLTGSPLRIPAANLAAFSLVAILKPSPDTDSGRHLSELWKLEKARDGLNIEQIQIDINITQKSEPDTGGHPALATPASQLFPAHELLARHHHLCALRDGLISHLPSELTEPSHPATRLGVNTPSPHRSGRGG